MADIAEQICQAVDTIVEQRLRSINFDTTIVATILDNRYAKTNQYTCYNGSSQFTAFSKDTSFEINDSVLVTIPNNDYSQQKIIVGKYVAENDKPFSYVKPFNTIIDVSSNLVSGWGEKIASLLANEDYDLAGRDENGKFEVFPTEIPLWSNTFQEEYVGFDRLGIQGQFRSWLKTLKAQDGDFGYRLEVLSNNGDLIEEEDEVTSETFTSLLKAWSNLYSNIINRKEYANPEGLLNVTPEVWFKDLNVEKTAFIESFIQEEEFSEERRKMVYAMLYAHGQVTTLYLNTQEMYGNPYDYQSFFEQESVFNISDIKNIVSMSLFFYQASNTFFNQNLEPLQYKKGSTKFNDNLFTKSPYICLGYDLSNFNEEQAILYSLDGDTYVTRDNLDEKYNEKTIRLRWLHKFENGQIKVVNDDTDVGNYEIRWYQYQLGAPSADEYSGVYWNRVEPSQESKFTYVLAPGKNTGQEKIKAIVIYNGKVIRSNILTFYNEKEVVSEVTAELLSGLSLWCDDRSYGNYYLYSQNNNLFSESDANRVRTLSAKFRNFSLDVASVDFNIEDESSNLTEASTITWEFPLNNTMLVVAGFNYYFPIYDDEKITDAQGNVSTNWKLIAEKDPTGQRYKSDARYENATIRVSGNTIYITRNCKEDGSIDNKQDYRIGKTFSQSYLNNTVKCTIRKNSLNYSATKEMSFGLMGTNGTDVTLVIDFDNNRTALTANKASESLPVSLHLYDSAHKEIDLNDVTNQRVTCKWEWFAYNETFTATEESSMVDNLLNWMKTNDFDRYWSLLERGEIPESTRRDLIPEAIKKYGTIRIENDTSLTCNISHSKVLDLNRKYFQILQVTVKGFGDYDLVAYKPIPIRKNNTYRNIIGPTEIIYDSNGKIDYFKTPYEMWWCADSSKIDEVYDTVASQTDVSQLHTTWKIYNPYNESLNYIGSFDDEKLNNILRPAPLYVKDVDPYGVACYLNSEGDSDCVWIQPLIVLQNNYPSATINKWSGKGIDLNEDEGYIIAPAIAAGKKDSDNKFSGVMIGDWSNLKTEGSISKQTGVYGFYKGNQSFGFKEDGTAFIGQSGMGRIYFDGTSGTIKSSQWDSEESGMFLDLDDGILKLQKNSEYNAVALTEDTYTVGKYYVYITSYDPIAYRTAYDKNLTYYKKVAAPINQISESDFEAKKTTLYTRKPVTYTQCTGETIFNADAVYYQEKYVATLVAEDELNNNKANYYIEKKEGEGESQTISYVPVTEDYVEGTTYFVKTYERVYIDSFGDNPTKYYTRDPYTYVQVKESDVYSDSTIYYQEGYEAQVYPITGPGYENWNTSLDENLIHPFNTRIKDKYYISKRGYEISQDKFDPQTTYYTKSSDSSARYITLSAAETTYPLSIGDAKNESSRKFKVDWNGTAHIENGIFKGNVTADYLSCEAGYVGGWKITSTKLTGKDIELNSKDGSIKGGILRSPAGGMLLDGFFSIANGSGAEVAGTYIGYMEANTGISDTDDNSEGVGMRYNKGSVKSQVKATSYNAGLSYDNGSGGYISISSKGVSIGTKGDSSSIRLQGSALSCTIPADKQTGIYARFA